MLEKSDSARATMGKHVMLYEDDAGRVTIRTEAGGELRAEAFDRRPPGANLGRPGLRRGTLGPMQVAKDAVGAARQLSRWWAFERVPGCWRWAALGWVAASALGCADAHVLTLNETLDRAQQAYCEAELACMESSGLPPTDDYTYATCIASLPDTARYEETHGTACTEALVAYRYCLADAQELSCSVDPLNCWWEFAEWTACF